MASAPSQPACVESCKVLVLVADGTEEIEAVSIIDTLRRAEIEVSVASVSESLSVRCSRGVVIVADALLSDEKESLATYDAIAIPGGMPGASAIADTEGMKELLEGFKMRSRWISAICAAPSVVLAAHGILTADTPATCFPADKFRRTLPNRTQAELRVVVDSKHRIMTSQGPGTAIEFALALAEQLVGSSRAESVRS